MFNIDLYSMEGTAMTYTTIIKIRGYHLDIYGHVNNARWVELMEEARWRWLDQDVDIEAWDEAGIGLAVAHLDIHYRQAAYMHDEIEFHCTITKLGSRSAVCHQKVFRRGGDQCLLDADVTFVFFNRTTGKPCPIPADAREAFTRYLHREARA